MQRIEEVATLAEHPARATYDAKTKVAQEQFLATFAHCGNIREAAREADVSRATVDLWRRNDAFGFLERFQTAREEFTDSLEEYARKRVEEPSHNGRIGSDTLLMCLLNANRPEKYRPDSARVDARQYVTQITINPPGSSTQIPEGQVVEALEPPNNKEAQAPEEGTPE